MNTFGQTKPTKLRILGRALQSNAILLRWSPDSSALWTLGNAYGYKLTRTTVKRNGLMLSTPENKKTYNIKISTEADWKAKVLDPNDNTKTNDSTYHIMMAGVLFGEVDYSDTASTAIANKVRIVNDPKITNVAQESLEEKYDMAMLTADLKFSVAKMAALGLSDLTTLNNEVYRYKIEIDAPQSELTTKNITVSADSIDIGAIDYFVYPKLPKLTPKLNYRSIELKWQIKNKNRNYSLEQYYVGYSILKTSNKTLPLTQYQTLNKQLLVSVTDGDTIRMNYIDSDSTLKTGQKKYYLLKGKSIFDEEVVTLDSLTEVIYTEKANYFPRIVSLNSNSTVGNYTVKWEFLPPVVGYNIASISNGDTLYNNIRDTLKIPVSQYIIKKSNTFDGVFTNLITVSGTLDSASITQINKTSYIKVVAVSPTYGEIESVPILVQPKDDVPPQKPIVQNAIITKDNLTSKQIVKVTWKRNDKIYSSDGDIAGYRVFKANRLNISGKIEEPSQITDMIHVWKYNSDSLTVSYIDTLDVKALSLNPKVYYKIQAFDKRDNHSILSDSIVITNPNKAKPSAPIFKSYQITKDGIKLTWIRSNDNTTPTKHILVRLETPFQSIKVSPLNGLTFNLPKDSVYTDKTVYGDTQYAYFICAIEDADTVLSNPLIVDVPGSILESSVQLDLKVNASRINNRIELKWTVTNEKRMSQFEIYRGVGSNQTSSWKIVNGDDLFTYDQDPKANIQYKYSIRGIFEDGTVTKWQSIQLIFPAACEKDVIIVRKSAILTNTFDEACEEIELKPGFDTGNTATNQKKEYKTKLSGQN